MKFWKTKQFSDASKIWEKKLKDDGFIDIEKQIGGEKELIDPSYQPLKKRKGVQQMPGDIERFFEIVQSHINLDETLSDRDRLIMQNYIEGIDQRGIIKVLNDRGFVRCQNRITITRVISRSLIKWKIPGYLKRKTK